MSVSVCVKMKFKKSNKGQKINKKKEGKRNSVVVIAAVYQLHLNQLTNTYMWPFLFLVGLCNAEILES